MQQQKIDWQNQARCTNKPNKWFFPDEELIHRDMADYTYGQAVCSGCPVKAACLDYAMSCEADTRWRFGLWGGLTPRERWVFDAEWRVRKQR